MTQQQGIVNRAHRAGPPPRSLWYHGPSTQGCCLRTCSTRVVTLFSLVPFAVIVLISTAAVAQDSEATLIQRGQQALRAEHNSRATEIFETAVQRFPCSKPAFSGLLLS